MVTAEHVAPDRTEDGAVFLLLGGKTCDPVGGMGVRIGDGQRNPVWRLIAGFQHLV